jgi:hypothetical protein
LVLEKPAKGMGVFLLNLRLFQNPVGFKITAWKSGQMPAFPLKSKAAVQKTEVLEQPHLKNIDRPEIWF